MKIELYLSEMDSYTGKILQNGYEAYHMIYDKFGYWKKADEYYLKMIKICLSYYGENHLSTAAA